MESNHCSPGLNESEINDHNLKRMGQKSMTQIGDLLNRSMNQNLIG
jgi:hypothetical protein